MANFCLTNLKSFYSFTHTSRTEFFFFHFLASDAAKYNKRRVKNSIKCLRSLSMVSGSVWRFNETGDNCWTQFLFSSYADYDFLTIIDICLRWRERERLVQRNLTSPAPIKEQFWSLFFLACVIGTMGSIQTRFNQYPAEFRRLSASVVVAFFARESFLRRTIDRILFDGNVRQRETEN